MPRLGTTKPPRGISRKELEADGELGAGVSARTLAWNEGLSRRPCVDQAERRVRLFLEKKSQTKTRKSTVNVLRCALCINCDWGQGGPKCEQGV